LLLASRSETDFDLYLIDLHRVQIRKKIPLRWRAKDLSGLYFSAIGIGLTRRDEYYFLVQYYQQPLKLIFKKQRLFLLWIYLRAKMLYRRHKNKH
jgi:heptose I phosphotransferase